MSQCQISSNSDIAGLGVRVATYIQALVTLLIASFMFLRHLSVHQEGLYAEAQTILGPNRTSSSFPSSKLPLPSAEFLVNLKTSILGLRNGLFVVSVSVIIAALHSARNDVLTVYHGLVVTNISFLNSFSAYAIAMILSSLRGLSGEQKGLLSFNELWRSWPKELLHPYFVLHTALVGSFSTWFWLTQLRADQDCVYEIRYGFFVAVRGPMLTPSLRYFFITYSIITAIPPAATVILTIQLIISVIVCMVAAFPLIGIFALFMGVVYTLLQAAGASRSSGLRIFTLCGYTIAGVFGYTLVYMAFCLTPLLWIHSTEVTVRLNEAIVEDKEEGEWSYGQTLALATAVMTTFTVVVDVVKWGWKVRTPKKPMNGNYVFIPSLWVPVSQF
ncbi:hypothetical protein DL96DRAFT_1621916 [Flagelloscypha sp. PMI_526]|nr:hypothetical protein DL96DRAFT_1621916 [Flagelloscypha sp. PMI_526]